MAKIARGTTNKRATIHDQKLARGNGGELHQIAEGDIPVLTTAQGGPVSDDQSTLRIGERGPSLIDDFHFREKIFHFDHVRPGDSALFSLHGGLRRPYFSFPQCQGRVNLRQVPLEAEAGVAVRRLE